MKSAFTIQHSGFRDWDSDPSSIRNPQSPLRNGFTLIEILVVIAIILALSTLTLLVVGSHAPAERLRSAGRSAQAAFLGARDRALHAKDRRGIRLLLDATDPSLANGFIYVLPVESVKYGAVSPVGGLPIEVLNVDTTGDGIPDAPRQVKGYGVDWHLLAQNGQLPFPPRVRINLAGNGQWYTFTSVQLVPATNPPQVTLDLTTDFADPDLPAPNPVAVSQASPKATCEIDLGNDLLPGHAPLALPSGVVVDLFHSQLPQGWYDQQSLPNAAPVPPGFVAEGPDPAMPGNTIVRSYRPALDIMFSPRGMVAGSLAGLGPLYLLLNAIEDASRNLSPLDAANRGDKLVLAVFPQTGHVQVYPIDPTDAVNNITGAAGPDGSADDLFRYAKLGSRPGL